MLPTSHSRTIITTQISSGLTSRTVAAKSTKKMAKFSLSTGAVGVLQPKSSKVVILLLIISSCVFATVRNAKVSMLDVAN